MANLFDLSGRVAIVTGSSRGIGRAIAERLAEHGASVVISSRKAEACAETAAAINRAVWPRRRQAGRGQHLLEGRASASGRRDDERLRPDRRSRLQRGFQSLLRRACRHLGRAVPEDPRQQCARQSLAHPHGRARHDRTEGRLDHHRILDRRAQRLESPGGLQYLQGRRSSAGAQSRSRARTGTTCASIASRRD